MVGGSVTPGNFSKGANKQTVQGYQLFKEHYIKSWVVKPFVKAAEMLFIVKCFVSKARKKKIPRLCTYLLKY